MKSIYWHYATITIPAGTVIYRATNFNETRLVISVTLRAKRLVTRLDVAVPGSEWMFNYGAYGYRIPLGTPGLVITNERSAIKG